MNTDKLFQAFLALREKFTVEDLVFVFTRNRALAFESLRKKFFSAAMTV